MYIFQKYSIVVLQSATRYGVYNSSNSNNSAVQQFAERQVDAGRVDHCWQQGRSASLCFRSLQELGYWATGRRPPTASATNLAFSLTPIPALLLFLHHFSSISIASWAIPSAWNRSLAASVLAGTPATVPTTDIERPTTARAGTPATSATCSSHAAMSSAATSRSMARQQMGKIPFGSGPSGLATSAAGGRSAVTMAIRVAAVSRLTRPARIA